MTIVKHKRNYFPSIFDDFFGDDWMRYPAGARKETTMPAVNVKETDKAFTVELAAPGLSKNDFNVEVDNDLLTISSEKEESKEDTGENYTRKEFSYTSFKRSFHLPETVESDKIEAKYDDGVLRLVIPKKSEKELKASKTIKIS